MKEIVYKIAFTALVFSLVACKKENKITSDKTATVYVINGINREDIQVKMNGSLNMSGANISSSKQESVPFGTGCFFYAEGGASTIEVVKNKMTTSLFSDAYNFNNGGIYTLLLTGFSSNAEAVLIDDTNMPRIDGGKPTGDADSLINIRFVNLSPNVQPLKVRIQGSVNDEATGLAYKSYTAFRAFSAKSDVVRYTFQFIENDVIVATRAITMSTASRFKSAAVVIYGSKGTSLSTATMYYAQ